MQDVRVFMSESVCLCEALPACMVGCIEDKLLFLIAFYPALITELLRLRTAGLQSVKTGVALHSNLRTKETLNCTSPPLY